MAALGRAVIARIESSIIPSMPSRVRDMWFHDAGLKTVHFWAPAFKWINEAFRNLKSRDLYSLLLSGRPLVSDLVDLIQTDSVTEICKGLVIAGLADSVSRPAEKLSVNQCTSLAATGVIWSRYSLVITPKNYTLLSVNLFVALTNIYQLVRIYNYRQSQKAATDGSP